MSAADVNVLPSDRIDTATGISGDGNLSDAQVLDRDYRTHRFLDMKKPLLAQVWNGGFSKEFYLEQVHRPRYYSKTESAPLLGNFLEPLSVTSVWVVPLVWLPLVLCGTYLADQGIGSSKRTAEYWLLGYLSWSLIEYGVHRLVFHVDRFVDILTGTCLVLLTCVHRFLLDNRVAITAHFLLHGLHHYLPMDKYRIVRPPTLVLILAIPFHRLAHTVFFWDWHVATAVFCGGLFGYVCFEVAHYCLHTKA